MLRMVTLLLGVITIGLSGPVFGQSSIISKEKLHNAILGEQNFSTEELQQMDLNNDGVVDVADVVSALKGGNRIPKSLERYKWHIVASFFSDIADTSINHIIPYSYSFALEFGDGIATVVKIPGFDPTKDILHQDIAQAGQIPGSTRREYSFSDIIPIDTKFSVSTSKNGQSVTLISEQIIIEADDPKNPTNHQLKRNWTIEINENSLSSGIIENGTIKEETTGFVPKPKEPVIGAIYMAHFSQKNLTPIEKP